MLDFTIKIRFFYIFSKTKNLCDWVGLGRIGQDWVGLGRGIIEVFNSKKVVLQKCLSARVTQTSHYNLIFDLTFVQCFYSDPQNESAKKQKRGRSIETKSIETGIKVVAIKNFFLI